jgi:adenine-specific DNA-methyltransferase
MTFLEILEKTLLQDKRFVAEDGKVLKAKVYDAAMAMDEDLLHLLLSEQVLKDHFFKKVNDTFIFDKVEFTWVLNSREFLPDSYTMYKNKIGLVDSSGDLISQKQDVTLVWPYKDCVLEGGQTKDDEKRDEVFYNETLAPDQVTRLLYPKALTNAKRYSYAGNYDLTGKAVGGEGTVTYEETTEFLDDDNLIIKGNNLLALSSLLRRYEGKVKLIYIDPPYNTGNDSFGYNDRFNHSSWLTFIKNRLELAQRLLKPEGFIVVQTDDSEQAYLKVLLDEIFGMENYINTVSLLFKNIAGASGGGEDKRLKKNVEYLTIYAKDFTSAPVFNDLYDYIPISELVQKMRTEGISWKYTSVLVDPGQKEFLGTTIDGDGDEIKIYKRVNPLIKSISTIMREKSLSEEEAYNKYGSLCFQTAMPQSSIRPRVMEKYKEMTDEPNELISIEYTPKSGKNKGTLYEQFYKGNNFRLFAWLKDVSEEKDGILYKKEKLGTFWDFVGETKNLSKEGQIVFENGKKPERLLGHILNLTTEAGDLVLDFFMGSGTTQAVALKMHRRFIGVEQMDYIEDGGVKRLVRVLSGERSGMSEDVSWSGGGSFVYCELAERSETLMEGIQSAKDSDSILAILDEATERGLLRPSVLPNDLKKTREEFVEFSLDEQRRLVMEVLDKNKLYVNLCDMEDANMGLSESSKAFTRSFYNLEKDTEV